MRRGDEAPALTDDLLVEILSRLPARSLCRFKCVSKSWRNLISDPHHRRKLCHTLASFFHQSYAIDRFPEWARHFTGVYVGHQHCLPLVRPALSFLPDSEHLRLVDGCNGLLLCRYCNPPPSSRFVVCNPTAEKWVAVPNHGSGDNAWTVRLEFDPAVSSHFHLFGFVEDGETYITGVEIYSSLSGEWVHRQSGWNYESSFGGDEARSVFFNGMMHSIAVETAIVAVDTNGTSWRTIPLPSDTDMGGFVGQSQGHLYFMNCSEDNPHKLSILVLKDYSSDQWTLMHTVNTLQLFRSLKCNYGHDYHVAAIHPECHYIFFAVGRDKSLVSYEMDRKELRVICDLGHGCSPPYLPYVPLFVEQLADGQ